MKVLAIGDLSDNIAIIKKFVKAEIHLINFPWNGYSQTVDAKKDIEFFKSEKIIDAVKRINEIKNQFDVCIAMSSTGILLAYLSDLNYITFFVGHDIRSPPFLKNSLDSLSTDQPIYNFNLFERFFYKKAYENAILSVTADDELFEYAKRIGNKRIRISGYMEDATIFNENIKPLDKIKTKFTFLSPSRMGLQKGTEKIWKALKICETDFEVLQVKWYDKRTSKEIELAREWINNKPKQVKFLPIMTKEELAEYIGYSDVIIGQVSVKHHYVKNL